MQLTRLPRSIEASNEEVMLFIRNTEVYGRGIGWVDAHLLVSAKLTGVPLATRDKRLGRVAHDLGLA